MTVNQPTSFVRLVRRNLMALIRNKAALLMPLIPIIITIILHIFLIDGYLIDYLKSVLSENIALSDEKCRVFINNWFSTNFVAVVTITYTMVGGVQVVEDKQNGAAQSILSLPIRRCTVNASYVFSSVIFGAIIGFIALITSMAFLSLNGKLYIGFGAFAVSASAVIMIAVVAGLFANIIAAFIKTSVIYNAFISVFSLIFAFSIGAVLPIAVMPREVNQIFSLFVFSEAAAILRDMTFTSNAINLLSYADNDRLTALLQAFDGELIVNGAVRSNGSIALSIFINVIALTAIYIVEVSAISFVKAKCVKC